MGAAERREREAKERRDRILDAARTLLLKKGLKNISMRQIAEISELGLGTIYRYFNSQEEIFAALSGDVFDMLYEYISRSPTEQDPPDERLRTIAAAFLSFSDEQVEYYDFLDYFISAPEIIFPGPIKTRIDNHGYTLLIPIVQAIEAGIESGTYRRVDSRQYALMLLGLVHGMLHFRKLQDTVLRRYSFEELYENSVNNFISGLKKTTGQINY